MTGAPDFVCVVCERNVDRRWFTSRRRDKQLPPVCCGCEFRYTEGTGTPKYGSIMDRRNAMRIAALSEALHGAAGVKQWGMTYGRA